MRFVSGEASTTGISSGSWVAFSCRVSGRSLTPTRTRPTLPGVLGDPDPDPDPEPDPDPGRDPSPDPDPAPVTPAVFDVDAGVAVEGRGGKLLAVILPPLALLTAVEKEEDGCWPPPPPAGD